MSYWPRAWAAATAASSRSSRSIRKDIFIDFSLFDAWRAGFRDVVFIIKREMEAEFRECIGDRMEQYFHDFLRRVGDDPKAECLLPTMVGDLMNRGELSVSVLSSADQWFGMTYHEDRPRVAAALQKLHDAGVYPDKLA